MSSIEENKHNLKRFRDSSDDASTSKKVTQNVLENENLLSFFQTFSQNQLEQCQFSSSFDPLLTTHIPIDQYELVDVNTEFKCQQMLEALFPIAAFEHSDVVLDIAVHFQFLSDANVNHEQCLVIENRYRMGLKELNFARLGCSKVFQIKSIEMIQYLQLKLVQWLSTFDSSFGDKNKETFSNEIPKRRYRFLTYDIKKALYLFEFGFRLPSRALMHQIDWHDLSVAIWLLDPEAKQFNIDELTVQDMVQIISQFKLQNQSCFFQVAPQVRDTNINDSLLKTAILFYLTGQYCYKLSTDKLYKAYKLIEIPVRLCLYSLQVKGVQIDHKLLEVEESRIMQYKQKLGERIFEIAGLKDEEKKKFNLNSPKQVASMLFGPPKLTTFYNVNGSAKRAKTFANKDEKNSRSTSKLALKRLQVVHTNRLPSMIIEWRKLNYALNQVVLPIKKALQTSHIHSPFLYCQLKEWSATGRIHMHKPNLIKVNKDFNVTEILQVPSPTIQLRKLICARENCVLVSADYSQLELRILAHFSKDSDLLNTLNNLSNDVFTSIASSLKGVEHKEVTYEMRQQAKEICYGINYGMGVKSLAEKLEVTQIRAQHFRENFYSRYKQIEPFTKSVIDDCKRNSYVETISNRRRYIPNISSQVQSEIWKGERQAVNTVIQGSAADVVKLSMIAVEKAICINRLDASLVMQMHDELMYEVKCYQQMQFAQLLKQQMEQMSQHLNVKLPVKISSGPNWGSLQFIDFKT